MNGSITTDMHSYQWVSKQLGLNLVDNSKPESTYLPLTDLVRLGLRRNPRRAQLLVSTVLGKHIPADPGQVMNIGRLLAQAVEQSVVDTPQLSALLSKSLVLGYAETATGLGHTVSTYLPGSSYIHSTRRAALATHACLSFTEDHSHATDHQIFIDPATDGFCQSLVVLVDDELSTGNTARNTIRALHRLYPRTGYIVAAIIDLCGESERRTFNELATELGCQIRIVSLAQGTLELPSNAAEHAVELIYAVIPDTEIAPDQYPAGDAQIHHDLAELCCWEAKWPVGLPETGRYLMSWGETRSLRKAAADIAARLATELESGTVLVVGTEELMFTPIAIAATLQQHHPDLVRVQSTTRSPVFIHDTDGYPIRSGLRFQAPEDSSQHRYLYNVPYHNNANAVHGELYDHIVVVVDSQADTPALWNETGLVAQLRQQAVSKVTVVTVPTYTPSTLPTLLSGPDFSSYPASDVQWLLTDLSTVELEMPVEVREQYLQGGGHYAQSLPVEYQPSSEYVELFHQVLAASARRVAHAVGVVTELVLASRGFDSVLVSLARAGTPIGVLMRRWAKHIHHLDLPHYTMSIVRDRGIDELALRWLSRHYDPQRIVFVDGWTGKGAITKELTAALADFHSRTGANFSSELAVLADPGQCVGVFGTRDDFLIPSACLNSTVSGLVSRTVLRDDLIGPHRYHGAKFYAELGEQDLSVMFIDTVQSYFNEVTDSVMADWPSLAAQDRTPTWSGWADVEKIADQYHITNMNLIKPGVGETTRVLLRRIPDRILIRPDRIEELQHVLLLARARQVPIVEVPELAFSCVGIIEQWRAPQ